MTWFFVGWMLGAGGDHLRQIDAWDVIIVLSPFLLVFSFFAFGERLADWIETRWPEIREERERQEREKRARSSVGPK